MAGCQENQSWNQKVGTQKLHSQTSGEVPSREGLEIEFNHQWPMS